MTPAIRDLLVGALRPYYLTLWGLVALGVAIPFAAAGWSRRAAARASVAAPR